MEQLINPTKIKKGRVPRKLKKEWKKNPYFNLFGKLWIREYKWNNVRKYIEAYWGKNKKTILSPA